MELQSPTQSTLRYVEGNEFYPDQSLQQTPQHTHSALYTTCVSDLEQTPAADSERVSDVESDVSSHDATGASTIVFAPVDESTPLKAGQTGSVEDGSGSESEDFYEARSDNGEGGAVGEETLEETCEQLQEVKLEDADDCATPTTTSDACDADVAIEQEAEKEVNTEDSQSPESADRTDVENTHSVEDGTAV